MVLTPAPLSRPVATRRIVSRTTSGFWPSKRGIVGHGDDPEYSGFGALKEIQQALQDGWIKPQALREDRVARLLAAALDPGEAEAIALALELSADLILLDERDGRSAAERAGLRVTGVLEVLPRQARWPNPIDKA
jgi:predicted nucleic acid-binding protein